MARTVDPELRTQLLTKVISYVRVHGVAEFSLRPLAAGIGSSPRALLYHFGSREQLLCAVFDTMRQAGISEVNDHLAGMATATAEFLSLWAWLAVPARRPTLRLFYEMYGISVRDPHRFGDYARRVAHDWLQRMEKRLLDGGYPPHRAAVTASAIVAMFRGATLELAATDDESRLTVMVMAFVASLELDEGSR